MEKDTKSSGYQPGYYGKKRQGPKQWVDAYFKKWEQEQGQKMQGLELSKVYPSICFSRQIGVGALEIADILSQIIAYRVVDRQILEHMAQDASQSMKLLQLFDERYPGRMGELFAMLTNEKAFIQSDYIRQLAKTVTALASNEPTIFVGRGIHLILPRDLTLSVRLTCSPEYRVKRLATILNIEKPEAQTHLDRFDREQRQFFKTIYQKEENEMESIDLLINRDYLTSASGAAEIVACAFERKFGSDRISP